MRELRDKWVLITGAANGIGKALTMEFAKNGSNIIIADIDKDGMERTSKEVTSLGCKTIGIRADMSIPEEVESLARKAISEAGQVDILVNNAGIAHVCEVQNILLEEWENILAINLKGPILLTHHLLPQMISRQSGHIVNIASMAGLVGIPGMAPYSTSKFGLVGYSETIRPELAAYGIGVTAVCPGVIRTSIIDTSTIRGFAQEMRDVPSIMVISPEKAAKIIVRGVRHNKAKVLPSAKIGNFLCMMKRISPGLTERMLKVGYSTWEKSPD